MRSNAGQHNAKAGIHQGVLDLDIEILFAIKGLENDLDFLI
jgi:hypothetical protein